MSKKELQTRLDKITATFDKSVGEEQKNVIKVLNEAFDHAEVIVKEHDAMRKAIEDKRKAAVVAEAEKVALAKRKAEAPKAEAKKIKKK